MYYIVYDKKKDVYRNFMGKNKEAVRRRFERYLNERNIVDEDWEVVEITIKEHRLIKLWFEEEHLLVSVDKTIVDNADIII